MWLEGAKGLYFIFPNLDQLNTILIWSTECVELGFNQSCIEPTEKKWCYITLD